MNKKFKKYVKIFIVFIQIALCYMVACNIFNFINIEKNIDTITKFICENIFILTIFVTNITTLILFKHENEKILHTSILFSSILSLIFFMDNLVLYNYIEVYIFYFVSVVFLLFNIFNFNLIGEKHSTFKFNTKKINKIIIISVLILAMILEIICHLNMRNNMSSVINNKELQEAGIQNIFNKELVKMAVKDCIYFASIVLILLNKKIKKENLYTIIYGILLIISVFSIKNTSFYYVFQYVMSLSFIYSFLERKKKIEI